MPPAPPSLPPPPVLIGDRQTSTDSIPHVIRRLLGEERDLVARVRRLSDELADPMGRARASAELDAIAGELERIETALDEADSDRLDAAAQKLAELETRGSLVYEALRTATSRTSAVETDNAR